LLPGGEFTAASFIQHFCAIEAGILETVRLHKTESLHGLTRLRLYNLFFFAADCS